MVHQIDQPPRNDQPERQPEDQDSQITRPSPANQARGASQPSVTRFSAGPAGEAQSLLVTLERLAQNVTSLLGAAAVSVALLDRQTGRLTSWVALGADAAPASSLQANPYADVEEWVAAHLAPALIEDLLAEPQALDQFPSLRSLIPPQTGSGAHQPPFRSLLSAPLMDGDHILGALTVVSERPRAFDPPRQRLLQVFSEQAALAVSKTLQAEANAAQARELGALLEASRALTSSLDPTQVFTYIVASIRKVIACDDAVIYVLDPGAAVLRVVAGMGLRGDRLGGARIALDDPHSIAAWVAQNRRARLSSSGYAEMGAITETFLSGDDLSLLCVPLISKGALRGVIMLARSQAFKPGELGAMLNLSNIVAATLENVDLFQQARAERAQQAAIFASASDGFAIVNGALGLSEVNEAFARMVGQPRDQLLGQRLCVVLQRQSSGACRLCGGSCLVAQSLQQGEAYDHIECEFPLSEPNTTTRPNNASRPIGAVALSDAMNEALGLAGGSGTTTGAASGVRRVPASSSRLPRRYVDFSVTPIMGVEEPHALLVGRDITAIREMDQMKSNFLSMVSHELRAPLQTINGYLDLSLSGMAGALGDQLGEFLRRARAGSEHLTSLVDDLLLLSRRDAGQFSLLRQPTDLAPIIRETVEELEITAEDAEVQLTLEMPDELPLAQVDGPRITQVMRNLVTNAIKFTPTGGDVVVTAEATATQVVIRVRDTGIGIAPEHLPKIFERFYQVGEGTTRCRGQGQGLGLAIVRIIVEGHGGTLHVESVPRKGSVFTVCFPRLPDDAGRA